MPDKKPSRANKGKAKRRKGAIVKKSLSLSPKAWSAVEKHAKADAAKHGHQINYSSSASELVIEGAESVARKEQLHITT